MYVQSFVSDDRVDRRLSESSTNPAECCEFDNKNRPIATEDIIRGPTCSGCCLLLQGLISGGALRYEYYYSSSTVVQRYLTSDMYIASIMYKARRNIHLKRAR